LLIGDARFDQGSAKIGIDFDDPVHPLEVKDDLSSRGWRGRAIAEILAGGDGPHRGLVAVADREDALYFLDARGGDRRRWCVGLDRCRDHDLEERPQCLGRVQYMLGADDVSEFGDRSVKSGFVNALG